MQDNENTSAIPTYIFASCKRWHQGSFNLISKEVSADWRYVSNVTELEEVLSATKPRYIFFLHWNWIVPEEIWAKYECVCFHMTDLPYGRGGSPLQNLILAGHTQTMLTALKMVNEMDAGPVYAKRPLSLDGTAGEIYLRGGRLSLEIIRWMVGHNPQPTPQAGEAFIFKRRTPEQSSLPTNSNLGSIFDFIRMLDAGGYPNAFIDYGNYRITFKNAILDTDRVIAEAQIEFNVKPKRDKQ